MRLSISSVLIKEIIQAAAVLAFSFGIFYLFKREPIGSDDCSYFDYAAGLQPGYANSNGQRLGLVIVIKFFQAIFGYSDYAYYGVTFAFFSALLLTTFFLIRKLSGVVAGFFSILWVCAEPTMLNNLTMLLPEVGATFWFVLGFLCFVHAFDQHRNQRSRSIFAGSSAVFLLFSVLTKETFVLLIPAILVYALWIGNIRRHRNTLVAFCVTGTGFLVVERIFYWIMFGDPFYRLHTVLGHHISGVQELWIDQGLVQSNLTWLELSIRFFRLCLENSFYSMHLLFGLSYYVWIFGMGLWALLITLILRRPGLVAITAFFLIGWSSVSLPIAGFDPLLPLLRTKLRYFLPVLYFLSLLIPCAALHALQAIREQSTRPLIPMPLLATFTLSLLTFFPLFFIFEWQSTFNFTVQNGTNLFHRTKNSISKLEEAQLPVNRVVGSYKSIRPLKFFVSEYPIIFDVELPKNERLGPGDIFIHRTKFYRVPSPSAYWFQLAKGMNQRGEFGVYYGLDEDKLKDLTSLRPSFRLPHGSKLSRGTIPEIILALSSDLFLTAPPEVHLLLRGSGVGEKVRHLLVEIRFSNQAEPLSFSIIPWKNGERFSYKWISPRLESRSIANISLSVASWRGGEVRLGRTRAAFTSLNLGELASTTVPNPVER